MITSILGTPQSTQPWANASSYAQLYEEASDQERTLAFQFATPTTFRQGKFDTPFPTPESVFNSLLKRWHKYSQIEFYNLSLEAIFPSYFDLKTEVVIDSRSKSIGCVGQVTYRILGDVDPLIIKQLNTLANFAMYCGIGRKTTMGMGMIRRINS
jgi:CRISPR-associated endoribonuclease Cas6